MRDTRDGGAAARQVFRLGAWLVEPTLDRISSNGRVVKLRPRAMDVLACLAARAGKLASKQELIDAVWRTEFVSDHAIIEDLGSKNGTYPNGKRLRQPTILANGDEIWIGRSVARFRFLVEGEPTQTEHSVT